MPLSQKSLETKPYNVCIDCAHIGKNCDGPNFLAMSTERWCEWCHIRKEYLDWTNAEIAERAGISKITVDRVMSGNVKDIRVTTMQAVTMALVNGSWGQYPCAMASGEKEFVDNPAIVEQCKHLQEELDKLKEYDEGRIDYLKEQLRDRDKLLAARFKLIVSRDRVIRTLAILLGVAVALIIAVLLIDLLNPHIGFFGA